MSYFCRYIDKLRRRHEHDGTAEAETWFTRLKTFFLCAPEKGLGLWLGSMSMYFLYLLSATVNHYASLKHEHITNDYTNGIAGFQTVHPLDLGGNSFVYEDRVLYFVVCGLYLACVVSWVWLVWFCTDPGIIDTRDANFEEVRYVFFFHKVI